MYNYIVIKNIWSKYKRTLWTLFVVVFIVAIFFVKTTPLFKNRENYRANQERELAYSTIEIQDLVNKDTDGDGILDWEESLWGTDPNKKETTSGISDKTAINKLKSEQGTETTSGSNVSVDTEKLTQTDKFSRELFATVTSLSQNGFMDQATADQIGSSLANQIQSSTPKKIYTLDDIKITKDDSAQAIKKYSNTLGNIYIKNKTKKGVLDVLEELMADEENIKILSEFDPIINQTKKIISESLKMEVPQSLALLHLELINGGEILVENITDMKLFESDTIRAMSAISQYGEISEALQLAANRLADAIGKKLNS